MVTTSFTDKTKQLIDSLKGVCTSYGLGNDGNEFKIIIQSFLYKFLNDKFAYEVKKVDSKLAKADNWEKVIGKYSKEEYGLLGVKLGANCAILEHDHFLSELHNRQNESDFAKTFDDTLENIAIKNNEIFSVQTESGAKVVLFERISNYISDPDKRDDFCRAIINTFVEVSFEPIFKQKFDFFATIFEYMIKDYNKDGGGKYAEYYTPHAVAKIMANILVPKGESVRDVTCYDPSAGSGSLLMNLAHAIGEDKCSIYSQDISQKSSTLLRLNLILNNLVHSIPHIIQGNTLTKPYHKDKNGKLMKFHYIVSNPPFKLDFTEDHKKLLNDVDSSRFFAGIPNIPNKNVDGMSIYTVFLQHVINSLDDKKGKAAIVVPTGFITAQTGIEKKIREKIIEDKMLGGVVSMPSNIFATTGTNVSILFLDKANKGDVVLIDASKLGKTVKDGKNNKTELSDKDEQYIINTFLEKKVEGDFSVVVNYDQIKEKNHSLSAGQYFDVKIEYIDITSEEYEERINTYTTNLEKMFAESRQLEDEIKKQLGGLKYE